MSPGDIILLWYMPYPLPDRLIYRVTDSHLGHVAIVLPDKEDESGLLVYEATPPRARKMPVDQYVVQMNVWAGKRRRWRERKGNELRVELLRSDLAPQPHTLANEILEAEEWLGTMYSMVWNWLLSTNAIHCSELVARCISASGLVDSRDSVFWGCEFSRVTPIQIRETMMKELGWRVVDYPL